MEFLRFGSSIPGSYWGCCACCIIQNFKVDPKAKASIQLVGGDGGNPVLHGNSHAFAGPTYEDIFKARIRFGTFDKRDMPNHAFLAILTRSQIEGGVGAKWLKILKENGFEFLRTVSNSVYGGTDMATEGGSEHYQNYLFGLFRNIGAGAIKNPLLPPKEWTDLPQVVPEAWQFAELFGTDVNDYNVETRAAQRVIWDTVGPAKLLTEAEVVAAGAPVTLAGLRSENKQELKSVRDERNKTKKAKADKAPAPSAFLSPAPTPTKA